MSIQGLSGETLFFTVMIQKFVFQQRSPVSVSSPDTWRGYDDNDDDEEFQVFSDPPAFFFLQTVEKLLDLLGTLDRWINETPPVDQPSRFGNKAFRTWFSKLEQVGSVFLSVPSVRWKPTV